MVIMESTVGIRQVTGLLETTVHTLQRWESNDQLALGERTRICVQCGTYHDRDLNAAVNLQRLATGAHAARTALPEASQAVTPGTAAGDGSAGGGKVTPVRHEHGQQDGSGQEEIGEHLCAPSR
jgi:putative transposase